MRFLLVALIFVFAACGSSNSNAPGENAAAGGDISPADLQIELSEVSGTCLNLEKYFQMVRSLPATVSARKLTKDIGIRITGNNLPRNFRMRLAAGNFQMLDATMADIPDFIDVKQEACSKVFLNTDGHREVYNIARAKPDSLTLENEWSGQWTITWKAVNKVQMDVISNVGDLLCDPNSKARLQTVTEITWGNSDIFTQTISADTISADYLEMVVEATGYPASLYSENKTLVVDRLKELQAWPVRAGFLQCY